MNIYEYKTSYTDRVYTCGGPWTKTKSCSASDLILVDEGVQCINCGAVNPHRKIKPTVVEKKYKNG